MNDARAIARTRDGEFPRWS